jgi:plastocyanin
VDRIMNRILTLAVAAAAVAVAVAACSSGNGSSSAAPSAAATTSTTTSTTTSAPAGGEGSSASSAGGTITIQGFKFGDPITVAPGATVTVTNKDTAAHDAVSDDQGKFRTPLLNQNETATFTAPTAAGTYKFSCSVHANMHGIGTLIVQG